MMEHDFSPCNEINCAECDAVNVRTPRVEKRLRARAEAVEHIAVERAAIVTESWQETDGEPLDVRRAKLFRAIMEKNPVVIHEGELIVGSQSKYLIGASPCVDYNPNVAFDALRSLEPAGAGDGSCVISPEEQEILRRLLAWPLHRRSGAAEQ